MSFRPPRFPKTQFKDGGLPAACPDFVVAKEAGKLVSNMNRMPVMVIDGVPIGQVPVIKRIVARRMGLLGDTDLEGMLFPEPHTLHRHEAAPINEKEPCPSP